MSFELKYDRNRNVITSEADILKTNPPVEEVLQTLQEEVAEVEQPEVVEEQYAEETEQESSVQEPEVDTQEQQRKEAQRVKDEISKEKSFAALRRRAEESESIRAERDEYARLVKELQEKQSQEEFTLGDDDLAEGKHLKKLSKEVQRLKQEADQYKQQSYLTNVEMKIKAKYPDFDSVVNAENIEALKEIEPELASSIGANPDLYAKAISAYTMIKKVVATQAAQDTYAADKERAARNALKPRPGASTTAQRGDSPLSQANMFADGLTPQLKAQLVKEMRDAAKRY